jgi:hypothetical protein
VSGRPEVGGLSPDGSCDSCGREFAFAPWSLDLEQLGADLAIHDCDEGAWYLHVPDEDESEVGV